MAVKIRLARRGRKKLAIYDVVVADARAPRDGRFIEKLGLYNPNTNPATIDINEDKALDWVLKGAQPTDTVRAMLSYRGVMIRKHLQIGVQKGAITQEEADKRFNEWREGKEAKISGKLDSLAKQREEGKKARLAAEAKVKEARTQERLAKQKELEANAVKAARKAAGEVAEEEAPAAEAVEETTTEAPAQQSEEAPVAEKKEEAQEKQLETEKKAPEAKAETPSEPETAEKAEKKEDSDEKASEAKTESSSKVVAQAAAGEEVQAEAGTVAEPTEPKAGKKEEGSEKAPEPKAAKEEKTSASPSEKEEKKEKE